MSRWLFPPPLSALCQKTLCGGTTETIPGSFLSEVHRSNPLLKGRNSWNRLNPVNKGVVLVLFLHMPFSKPGMKKTLIRRLFGETPRGVVTRILLLETCRYRWITSCMPTPPKKYSTLRISVFYFHLVKIPEWFWHQFCACINHSPSWFLSQGFSVAQLQPLVIKSVLCAAVFSNGAAWWMALQHPG